MPYHAVRDEMVSQDNWNNILELGLCMGLTLFVECLESVLS